MLRNIRIEVYTKGQLIGSRIASWILLFIVIWSIQSDIDSGGLYFQGTFYTDGLYHAQIVFEVVFAVVLFWFGTLGLMLSNSKDIN